MRVRLFSGLGLALLIAASSALGQQRSLTLADAIATARQNNPAFRKLQNDADVAAADVRQSLGALLPSINADMQFSGYSSSRVTGENDYGQPVRLPAAIEFKGSSAQQGVGLRMTLFDGGASLRGIGAARAGAVATDARIAAEAARLTGDVTRQYYAALRAARLVDVEKRLLGSAKERLDRTEQLLRVAGSSPADVLGARAEVASQQQQVARAEADARKQSLLLNELMGAGGEAGFALASDVPSVIDAAQLSAETLLGSALQNSPVIREADAAATAAQRRSSAAHASRFPTISAGAQWGRSMSLSSYDALFEMNPKNHAFNFSLGASLPIFNNFRPSYTMAQASAAESDAREDVRATRLRVERLVRSALIDLQNSHEVLQLAEQKAALSRERLELAQEQYRNGAMSFTELQNVIDRTADAERQVVDARFGYANARTYLEEYTGASLEAEGK